MGESFDKKEVVCVIKGLLEQIENDAVLIESEWGHGDDLTSLIADGDMPFVYYVGQDLLNSLEEDNNE